MVGVLGCTEVGAETSAQRARAIRALHTRLGCSRRCLRFRSEGDTAMLVTAQAERSPRRARADEARRSARQTPCQPRIYRAQPGGWVVAVCEVTRARDQGELPGGMAGGSGARKGDRDVVVLDSVQ